MSQVGSKDLLREVGRRVGAGRVADDGAGPAGREPPDPHRPAEDRFHRAPVGAAPGAATAARARRRLSRTGPAHREAAEFGLGFRRADGQSPRKLAWRRLLRQINDPDAVRVCISHEAFGRADDDQIRRIVAELGGSEPHVVAVARRYDTLMPSQWQQRVRPRSRCPTTWLRVVLDDDAKDEPGWRNLWSRTTRSSFSSAGPRWSVRSGSPSSAPRVPALPRARDVRAAARPAAGSIDMAAAPRANTSLTYTQVEVLRRLNVAFEENGWSGADYHRLVRQGVVYALMNTPAQADEARIPPLPRWARDRLVELSDRRIEGLRSLPVRVVGDLEALRVSSAEAPEDVAPPAATVPRRRGPGPGGLARGAIDGVPEGDTSVEPED